MSSKKVYREEQKMRKKKITERLMSSGVWIQPFIMAGLVKWLQENKPDFLVDQNNWFVCLFLSFLPVLLIWTNEIGRPKEETAMQGKQKAMYPEIPADLLCKEPQGIILGKDKATNEYVCKRLSSDGHIFLVGGSGSGKSSCCVLPALIANPNARTFAVDIKGELSFKAAKIGSENVLIFNPADRGQCGYDPLYLLDENSTTQEIMETMQTITFSLISMPADIKETFWKNSARNLLIGLMIYFYKQGSRNFVDIIDQILGKPIKESIQEIMENSNPNNVEYRCIVQFNDMADETLGGIVTEMNNHIVIFSNDQDIRYAFKDNICKINPLKLEEGYSIYLSIREEKLTAYYDVMQLIINQTLAQLEKRPEDSEPVIFVIDEMPRILSAGKLDRLLDGARTLRSRKVCLFMITQSVEALMTAYSENEVADLISNCPFIIVLSASSPKTQQMVCSWCGKYKVKKISWSGGDKDRKTNVSYEEHDIVDPSDLMTLRDTGEAILITPYGYCRAQKVPYYADKYLKVLAAEVAEYNKTINSMKEETKNGKNKNYISGV